MKAHKRIAAYVAAILMLFSLLQVCAGESAPIDIATAGDTVLTFTSDVHHTSANTTDSSAKRLGNWLDGVKKELGEIGAVCICGDLGSPYANSSSYWRYASAVFDVIDEREIPLVCTTGNHEYQNGSFTPTKNATTQRYIRLGEGKAADNYAVFCLGAASKGEEFPQSDVDALKNYLKSVGTEKPVFILSHYPLHTFSNSTLTREFKNADQIIALLNHYPNAFFVWGHNHSQGDLHYDKVIRDEIQIKKGQEPVAIQFTYLAAGAMTEVADGNPYAGSVTGKGLVARISPAGRTVSLQYRDKDGEPLADWVTIKLPPSQEAISGLLLTARQVAGIEVSDGESSAADLVEMARALLAA